MSPIVAMPAAQLLVQDGIAKITHTPDRVTIHNPGTNYIFAPLNQATIGIVSAGTAEPGEFVQQCNYANVETTVTLDPLLAAEYYANPNVHQHVMNAILSRVGQQLYNTTWNTQTGTTAPYNFDNVYTIDGNYAINIPPNITSINYNNGTATTLNQMRVTLTGHVTPEIFEQAKKYQEMLNARHLIQQLRDKMRTVSVHVKKNKGRKFIPADHKVNPQELKARETLREMIPEWEYRRYLTNGFIMVKAKSGLWYQIFNKQAGYWVFSFKDGKMFERLCIHTDAVCPPTDHVINMKVLAEIDEETLRKGANITTDYERDPLYRNVIGDLLKSVEKPEPAKPESLLDVYRRLKKTA
jgi:hypothetical protein